MSDVDRARNDVLEACRMLGIYTVNMLEYARWDFRACQPRNVRRAIRRLPAPAEKLP